MLECLIIGGGIHGIHLANRLVTVEGLPLDKLMILDPHDAPCQRWKELTGKTGMKYLRSPLVHHVDVDPWSLQKFMARPEVRSWASTIGVTERPSLRLFNAHIDHVVDKSQVYRSYRKALVTGLKDCGSHMVVESNIGSIEARRVILAVSSNEVPRMPAWGLALQDEGAPVNGVFQPSFDMHSIIPSYRYAVVGSGLSAVQLALAIASIAPGKSTLITKGPVEVNDLDFDPCWVGPKCMEPFGKIADYGERRSKLNKARNVGSIPRAISATLRKAQEEKRLTLLTSRANAGTLLSDGSIDLELQDGRVRNFDRVVFAIGFEKQAPGQAFLSSLIEDCGLAVHEDGYPIVDRCLRWSDKLFVTGALAELEVGAASRNVIGARIAGERIGPVIGAALKSS